MAYEFTGKHLIAGRWVAGSETFTSSPAEGPVRNFSFGSAALVDEAVRGAEEAFESYGYSSRAERAAFLEAIAEEIDARGDDITEIGSGETGLPKARLVGERGRTVGQLRLFAAISSRAIISTAAMMQRCGIASPCLARTSR
jgi:NADP-dependent aldehyde dehydrogenase